MDGKEAVRSRNLASSRSTVWWIISSVDEKRGREAQARVMVASLKETMQ